MTNGWSIALKVEQQLQVLLVVEQQLPAQQVVEQQLQVLLVVEQQVQVLLVVEQQARQLQVQQLLPALRLIVAQPTVHTYVMVLVVGLC
jgi:hypothetical protein